MIDYNNLDYNVYYRKLRLKIYNVQNKVEK